MNAQQAGTYDFTYSPENVYGHVVALLARQANAGRAGLHLDLGCGFGRIAEPLRRQLPRSYVGCDADTVSLASLRERGFETHELVLGDEAATHAAVSAVIAGRAVASISILDTLEHLPDPVATLRALRRIAGDHGAVLVLSVPNVTHRDVGLRLAFGRWDYVRTGLLDHTHRVLFGADALAAMLRHVGLYEVDSYDTRLAVTELHFPPTHPALSAGSSLHDLLTSTRNGVDQHGDTYQFVRVCIAGPASADPPYAVPPADDGPFLSIVVRTQGKRDHTLRELFACLAGQSCDDFEVLVMGHRLTVAARAEVQRSIDDNPDWLRHRVRLIAVDDGNRTRPLNVGFAAAAGRYIAIMDDDDLPFAHWVEVFRDLEAQHPGRVLRAVTVIQPVTTIANRNGAALRATGGFERRYPATFDFLDHLRTNRSPTCALAFPRGCFHDLAMRFDETLTTTEDWDFLIRSMAVVGVAGSPEITAIYRWWGDEGSSRTAHQEAEWSTNYLRIAQKLDDTVILLPPGGASAVRHLLDERDRALEARDRAMDALQAVASAGSGLEARRLDLLRQIDGIRHSNSWRLTVPLRWLGRLTGRPRESIDELWDYDVNRLQAVVDALLASTSWRLSAPLRAMRGRRPSP